MSALVAGYCLSLRLRADGSDGWEPHDVLEGDGHGGWTRHAAQRRFLPHHNVPGSYTMPFGLLQMDNGEVILAGSWNDGSSTKADLAEKCFVAFSRDRGDHWTDFSVLSDAIGRPMMLTDLGRGRLMFQTDPLRPALPRQFFSADYGRSWPQSRLLQKAANDGTIAGPSDEGIFATEGNALVDHDSGARAIRIAEIGWNLGKGKQDWPRDPAIGILRWSSDGGRTWTGEIEPPAWRQVTEYGGRKYLRGVCEGSLVRAANGWIVAALRTDLEPRFLDPPYSDNLEGTAVSISKDNGRTWSSLRVLFDSGRHHAHLLRLPDGDLLMTLIVRADMAPGERRKASYRQGCEAVISRDNGLTWDLGHKLIVDGFYFHDPDRWYFGKCGHLSSCRLDNGDILTAYGNYAEQAIAMVRWRLPMTPVGRIATP